MSNTELESLVRVRHDGYVRVAWLLIGDRDLAVAAVKSALHSLLSQPSPKDADARKAVVRTALQVRRKNVDIRQQASNGSLSIGSTELIAVVAIDWAGLSVAQTAHLTRLAKDAVDRQHVSALSQIRPRPGEDQRAAVARAIGDLAAGLSYESLAHRSELIDELKRSTPRTRRRWVLALSVTLVMISAVAIWIVKDHGRSDNATPLRLSDARPPKSLASMEDLSKWAIAACKQPGGDFDTLAPNSITGKLESQAKLSLAGALSIVDDRMVSLLLLSPANQMARFCFGITHAAAPKEVDWYIAELSPSEVLDTVAVRPDGVAYFVVIGGEANTSITKDDSDVNCPDAQVVAQSFTQVSALGTTVWQAACSALPDPEGGSLTIKSKTSGLAAHDFPVKDFREVPLVQTLRVQSSV